MVESNPVESLEGIAIQTLHECRNCGSSDLRELGFRGYLAPFFLKRVLHAEVINRRASNVRKRRIQRFTAPLQRLVSKIHPPAVAVELQSCQACSFVQTKHPFADDAISRLYVDYRAESYNRERSHYEPDYINVASQIGQYTESGQNRIDALTGWLKSKAVLTPSAMLDFGGAEGKYLPDLPGQKFVYEVSDVSPAPGVTRIPHESSLGTYDYVQISHVLEHVTHPKNLARHVASFVAPGGYLLIEVPQDLDASVLNAVQTGKSEPFIAIHEHINFYSVSAVEKLIDAVGLECVAIEAVPVVSPLARQFFVRGLARRATDAI